MPAFLNVLELCARKKTSQELQKFGFPISRAFYLLSMCIAGSLKTTQSKIGLFFNQTRLFVAKLGAVRPVTEDRHSVSIYGLARYLKGRNH